MEHPITISLIISLLAANITSCSDGNGKAEMTKKEISNPHQNSLTLSVEEFQQKIKENPVVLADFSATWCRPCRMLAPIIDSIAKKQKGKVLVLKLDTDLNKDLTQKMMVSEIPTLLLFKGGKQAWRGEGVLPESMIMDAINNN